MKDVWMLVSTAFLTISVSAQNPPVNVPAQISSQRPMDQAAQLLERLYGKVITYEEPVLVWTGDVVPNRTDGDPNRKWGLEPRPYTLALPPETGTDSDVASIIQKIVVANNAQPVGPRFRLLTSKWGYHIVPAQSHDGNGSLVAAQSVLDPSVYIPNEMRTPSRHLEELLAAIKSASGIPLERGMLGSPQALDYEFLGRQGSFEWGASGISGRDALIDLFERSATTYLWFLKCQSSTLPQDRFCVLNMRKLEVFVTDPQGKSTTRVLRFDRCADCPPPHPLPLPPNRR